MQADQVQHHRRYLPLLSILCFSQPLLTPFDLICLRSLCHCLMFVPPLPLPSFADSLFSSLFSPHTVAVRSTLQSCHSPSQGDSRLYYCLPLPSFCSPLWGHHF